MFEDVKEAIVIVKMSDAGDFNQGTDWNWEKSMLNAVQSQSQQD